MIYRKMSPPTTLFAGLLLLTASSVHRISASGVFELELIELQRLDAGRPPDQSEDSPPVRVSVCLKEAFASQLDGPCPFGTASLTLNRGDELNSIISGDKIRNSSLQLANNQSYQQISESQEQSSEFNQNQRQQQQQPGSPMTNIVRILFTFRWTKSFTIILTAEQIGAEDQTGGANSPPPPPPPPAHLEPGAANRSSQRAPGQPRQRFVDRHVLTENEVLPNLEPNPNKLWASRFSRSLKSSLAYRFRVYCSLNYYADGCTTFCRPRDDQFGHYNCSTTGQKLCLEGWTGADCDKAKCRPGCNLQHGYCDRPDTCQCRPGWAGARCDECLTYPGCRSGYCLSPWQCICQRNWGGVLCDQDLNFCGTHEPCKNNGTCQNVAPGKYRCTCPEGFAGLDCGASAAPAADLSAGCALSPCLNGGTCFGFDGHLLDSPAGASQPEPAEWPAAHELASDRPYRCQCPVGWTGDYCQWSDSALQPMTSTLLVGEPANRSEAADGAASDSTQAPDQADRPSQLISIPDELDAPSAHQAPATHLDMRHLISGVVVASVLGVFMASVLLAWCCLMAIEQNRFSFIQMNIVRGSEEAHATGEPAAVGSTLRRMQAKIRDSLRRSARIKPETKLSIDNVLRAPKPPPSYEESSNYLYSKVPVHYPSLSYQTKRALEESDMKIADHTTSDESLVIRGAPEQEATSAPNQPAKSQPSEYSIEVPDVTSAQLRCPRHGHLYRHQTGSNNQIGLPLGVEIHQTAQNTSTVHIHHSR